MVVNTGHQGKTDHGKDGSRASGWQ